MGGINVVATYGALLLMDKCGRKTLIMWSCGGMFFSCVVIVLSLKGYLDKMVALVAVASYVCFFEIGLGPIPVSCVIFTYLVMITYMIHHHFCILLNSHSFIFVHSHTHHWLVPNGCRNV